ncbi:MAG: aminotransferase DegT [Desulfurococcales archaeon ex4484_204]|nr:MAG: aminotransferase DegT [Desulfurococcales archaeon ex4484_204]
MIKVNSPLIGDEEVEAVAKVLRSGILAASRYVREFEEEFSRYLGVKHVVTVSNGTIALYALLKALGIGGGDEVIVPDFTFFSTASMVAAVGAKPVFTDIDLSTYTIDPNAVERSVSDRTRAVIAVHLYGHPADMDEVVKVARERGLYVVEDCAQSHGAEYRGVKTGGIGDVGAFSFYATKNLTMGEGGAISTNRDDVAGFVRLFRNHGQTRRYHHEVFGWNFRITEVQAAIGLQQLRRLDYMNERRREVARIYLEELSSVEGIRLPVEKPWAKHVYHQFTIWVEDSSLRGKLAEFLGGRGIQTSVHYPKPLHEQPVFRGYVANPNCCPNSSAAASHVLSLPMHPLLTDEEVVAVARAVKEFFSNPP